MLVQLVRQKQLLSPGQAAIGNSLCIHPF